MRETLIAMLSFAASLLNVASIAAENSIDLTARVESIDELWAGYDPRREPLDITIEKAWDEAGTRIERLRFTAETRDQRPVRVFAYRGTPIGVEGKFPGVIHIHGGGQTASLEWIRFWGMRGYACVSFDFCGQHPGRAADVTTDWGSVDANMLAPLKPPTIVEPTARHSAWFHWALVSRRAITLLEQHPQVNAEKLGVFGVSVGGTLTWLVAGVDDRVRAAVPIYGVGQNSYTYPWEKPAELIDPQRRRFRDLLECESYAPRIKCPLLWLNSSNDHHGRLDLGMRTLHLTAATIVRQAYTPRYMHHIAPAEAADLPLWMDWHLKGIGDPWPVTPELNIHVQEPQNVVVAEATVDRPEDIEELAWHWGINNPWPMSRHYHVVRQRMESSQEKRLATRLSISSPDDTIYAFVNATYRSGVVLSSRLETFSARGKPVRPDEERLKLIDSMSTADAWYWFGVPTDPCHLPKIFETWTGPGEETGFITPLPVFQFATNLLSDPWRHGRGRQALQFDVLTQNIPAELEVEVAERFFQPGGTHYKFRPTLSTAEDRWTTISLRPELLQDATGNSLSNWKDVDYLLLRGKHSATGPAVFRNLRWESLEE
jgi:dienelactone hydrolase